MEPSTTRQLWAIAELLKGFRRGGKSNAELRKIFPSKDSASKAIEQLKKADSREADKINALPVEMRLIAHKELTDEEWKKIKNGEEI